MKLRFILVFDHEDWLMIHTGRNTNYPLGYISIYKRPDDLQFKFPDYSKTKRKRFLKWLGV